MSFSNSQIGQLLQQKSKFFKGLKIEDILQILSVDYPDFRHQFGELYIDFNRQLCNPEILNLLLSLAEEKALQKKIKSMFDGESINNSENRPVLHTALRSDNRNIATIQSNKKILISKVIEQTQKRMFEFSQQIHQGKWRGFSGKKITDIVNIGIGGSDLGPRMVCQALKDYALNADLNIHFCAGVDGDEISDILQQINVESTLFIVISKSFSTQETLLNAQSAIGWFKDNGGSDEAIKKHFIAVTAKVDKAVQFGIKEENIYPMWDWVGGRYSVWSAVGFSVLLQIGEDNFKGFLNGAKQMDEHFKTAILGENLPVLMALFGIWNINFLNFHSLAVLPYNHRLSLLTNYLQQLEMESNGKSVDKENQIVKEVTAPVLWGGSGNCGQHAYYQLLHQGKVISPIDFILAIKTKNKEEEHQQALIANLLAHSSVLSEGKFNRENADNNLNYQRLNGAKPFSLLLLKSLTPASLGQLIALYEHKVFVQGVMWDINSFDQWGVEEGKNRAKQWTKLFFSKTSTVEGEVDKTTAMAMKFIKSL